jgi:hypothetical protein
MWFHASARGSPETLHDVVRRAETLTPDLMTTVLDLACARFAVSNRADDVDRIRHLIDSGAWTDAALALVALDRARAVRRLACDDGEWCCILGSQWPIPEWLDDTVEFRHATLPLAILGAVLAAWRHTASAVRPAISARTKSSDAIAPISCDNYA